MIYFLVPLCLLIYCEILGRAFFALIKKEPIEFSFVIGFVLIMSITYVTSWPITTFGGSFTMLLVLYGVLFIVSFALIITQIRRIDWHFNYKLWIVFFILLVLETYITLNRTLGEIHGFDTLSYLNEISLNIGNPKLYSFDSSFGNYVETRFSAMYSLQSYYSFIEVVIYIVRNVAGLFGKTFENLPAVTLSFQLFLHCIFIGSSLMCIKELKTKLLLQIAFICLLVLFINNFYFNNSLGFIGNSYRMPLHAIATLFLFRYFKSFDIKDFLLFMIVNLGICGLSSTGTFSFVLLLFGLFFYLYDKEQNLIKWYSAFLLIPVVNIILAKYGQRWIYVIVVVIIFTVIYFLNDVILKIFKNKYIRYGLIVAIMVFLYVLSIQKSGKLIDISNFFTNHSENADMSWDYFEFNDIRHWLFNLLVLIPIFYYLVKEKTKPFAIVAWVLILTIFNPLFSSAVVSILLVYYRSYDVLINNFTIIFFINYLINSINRKEIQNLVIGTTVVSTTVLGVIQVPRYQSDLFEVKDGYNRIMRIDDKELEVINNVRQMIDDLKIENPKIINSGSFFMESFITNATYMYGREKRFHDGYDNEDLYLIFFPLDGTYDNFYPIDAKPKYEEMKKLLKESDYNILVLDDNAYYDKNGIWTPLRELVEECGYEKTKYSTNSYSVYYLK